MSDRIAIHLERAARWIHWLADWALFGCAVAIGLVMVAIVLCCTATVLWHERELIGLSLALLVVAAISLALIIRLAHLFRRGGPPPSRPVNT